MSTPGLVGFLDILYLPPNNWEYTVSHEVTLYSLESQVDFWSCQELGKMKRGQVKRICTSDEQFTNSQSSLKLIYPSTSTLPESISTLPEDPIFTTRIPEWRATTGFLSSDAQTSYQGELFPFPSNASLLTFHPFIQYGSVQNKLVILNLTKSPEFKTGRLLFFDSSTGDFIAEKKMFTNSTTTIDLDDIGYRETQLPAIVSPDMAGVPFGLGIFQDGQMLSMEHTHPPASLVLFGDRFSIQGSIKRKWFSRLLGEQK